MREKAKIYLTFITGLILLSGSSLLHSQPVPAGDENIPYLMTFGKSGSTSWGDDDFSQTFFFKIPKGYTDPFYIRVYDPDIGGDVDEINGQWDTRMSYSVYGGATSYTHADAKGLEPTGKYRSGTLLASKVFVMDNRYDQSWYTFGPFNPAEGEFVEEFDGYIFKIICEGESGDDGNLYRYYLSKRANENIPIENGNAFTYEYSFRMWNDMENVSHIYPYVDTSCIFVKQRNFDWDDDGIFRVVSVSRKGQLMLISNEDDWADSKIKLFDDEKNTSLDFQFYKKKSALVRNNNVVISVENQYGELLPFFTIPIGGVPVFKAKTAGKPVPDTRNQK
ncbi:MAG: hypothetical protein E4G95_06660 [Bacteroidia bacterium]|nr:MAG: hypothetical protein E4G95_06660 [Bacteroidia bacterium]